MQEIYKKRSIGQDDLEKFLCPLCDTGCLKILQSDLLDKEAESSKKDQEMFN
jgi:hypothetical protein